MTYLHDMLSSIESLKLQCLKKFITDTPNRNMSFSTHLTMDSHRDSEGDVPKKTFGAHDWSTMKVDDWARHTSSPQMYVSERSILYRKYMPALLQGHEVTGTVLFDVGCGLGDDSLTLAQAFPGLRVVGIDFNKEFLAEAKRRQSIRHDEDPSADLKGRVRFEWADLASDEAVQDILHWRDEHACQRAIFYMGGNTIGIMPEGLERNISKCMLPNSDDRFLVVAHDAAMLPAMYECYYKVCVGEFCAERSDFDDGLYVAKESGYKSQWFTPQTLTARIRTHCGLRVEVCERGHLQGHVDAGVFGIYKLSQDDPPTPTQSI